MAIEKKLIHFNKREDFDDKLKSNQIKDSSIVFVKDANIIYTRKEEYQFIKWGYIGEADTPEPPIDIPVGYSYVKLADGDY